MRLVFDGGVLLNAPESSESSLFELPLLPTHGALVLGLLGAQPFHDAVDVKAVAALAPHLIRIRSAFERSKDQ